MLKKYLKPVICSFIIFIFFALFVSSSTDLIKRFVLDNGLELFVVENHTVPLAWVQITFRCGARTQTPETTGLFHLYEHMLFKGNEVYKDQTSFSNAMKELGVTTWNGGTSGEYVTYYFSVPSDKVEKGIEFWANAVRYPLFDKNEFEAEKKVVINEIKGYNSDPKHIFFGALDKALFYKYPWRKDVGGAPKHIEAATIEQMIMIKNTFYVPNNAALFVGGDVNPDEVLEWTKKYFGSWERSINPIPEFPPHPELTSKSYLVYSDSTFYKNFIFFIMQFKGPDVLRDPEATYAADVWGTLLENPNGKFKNNIFKKLRGLYKKDYIVMYYYTQRDGGEITFYTYMTYNASLSTPDRIKELEKIVLDELKLMASDPKYFSNEELELAKRKLSDHRVIESEKPSSLISNLSFWWASASTDYYFNYLDNCNKVKYEDIVKFLQKYVLDKNYVLAVRMNSKDFEKDKDAFSKSGFTFITEDNAYWWK
jgi:zinc protease